MLGVAISSTKRSIAVPIPCAKKAKGGMGQRHKVAMPKSKNGAAKGMSTKLESGVIVAISPKVSHWMGNMAKAAKSEIQSEPSMPRKRALPTPRHPFLRGKRVISARCTRSKARIPKVARTVN